MRPNVIAVRREHVDAPQSREDRQDRQATRQWVEQRLARLRSCTLLNRMAAPKA